MRGIETYMLLFLFCMYKMRLIEKRIGIYYNAIICLFILSNWAFEPYGCSQCTQCLINFLKMYLNGMKIVSEMTLGSL